MSCTAFGSRQSSDPGLNAIRARRLDQLPSCACFRQLAGERHLGCPTFLVPLISAVTGLTAINDGM